MRRILDGTPRISDLRQPGQVGVRYQACRNGCRDTGSDGSRERKPLGEVGLRGPCLGIAQVTAKQVNFIADLEILQSRAEGFGGKFSFVGGAGRSVGSHIDAVKAGPTGRFEECGQVPNRFRSNGIVAQLSARPRPHECADAPARESLEWASTSRIRWCCRQVAERLAVKSA